LPATVTIDILPTNRPPVFVSKPPTRYLANSSFSYASQAIDPDPGDTVTYSLKIAQGFQAGQYCSMGSASGILSCSLLGSGQQYFVIVATDSFGASAYQTIQIEDSSGTVAVPNVVGLTQTAAGTALIAAGFVTGGMSQVHNAAAAGTVLAQFPAAASLLLSGESVDLSVSSGPTPVGVPNIVGKTLSSAGSTLTALNFSTGVTTYQFDATQPRGTVLVQNPAAGAVVVPGPVAVTVSAGSGLDLRLSRNFTTTDVQITVTPVAIDLNGNESPATVTYAPLAAIVTPFLGPMPALTGNTITFDPATRGAFRITAADGGGHTANATFAVAQPIIPGQLSQMDDFAKLTEVFQGIDGLLRQASAAVAANDTPTAQARLRDIVNLWRTIDVDSMKLSTPFSPDGGFPPGLGDMAGFGVVPGPDDAANKQLLIKTEVELQAWTDGLNASGASMTQLRALAAAFADDASRLPSLTPGEYGVVDGAPDYALIAAHRIPDLMEAMMNQLGQVVGLPPRVSSYAGLSSVRPVHGLDRVGVQSLRPRANSTLAEVLTAEAVNYALDTISDAKKYATAVLSQAAYGMAIVAAANHLKAFLQAQEPESIISGPSLSFRTFGEPFAMIEGRGLEKQYPDLNTVIVIGPDLFDAVKVLVDKIKSAARFNLNPADSSGNPRYKNVDEATSDMKKFKSALDAELKATNALVKQAENAFQSTTKSDAPCLFSSASDCVELLYPDGFTSVYTYTPPGGLGSFTGLPLPIVFIIKNNVNGQFLFDTPVFFPTKPAP
jgi:hypothetical protein